MRIGFWLPWWLLPFYLVAWLIFAVCIGAARVLVWAVMGIIGTFIDEKPQRRDQITVRVTVSDRDEKP